MLINLLFYLLTDGACRKERSVMIAMMVNRFAVEWMSEFAVGESEEEWLERRWRNETGSWICDDVIVWCSICGGRDGMFNKTRRAGVWNISVDRSVRSFQTNRSDG